MKTVTLLLVATLLTAFHPLVNAGDKVTLSPKVDMSPDGRFGTKCFRAAIESEGEQCRVSFYRLLASPEDYHGRSVIVTGYLAQVFDRLVLYPNHDSFAGGIEIEGVEIEDGSVVPEAIRAQAKDGRANVAVVGVFDGRYAGIGTPRLGMLRTVRRVFDATPPAADRSSNW
jgi:hypothetical protein